MLAKSENSKNFNKEKIGMQEEPDDLFAISNQIISYSLSK